jgi:hypothetical protein
VSKITHPQAETLHFAMPPGRIANPPFQLPTFPAAHLSSYSTQAFPFYPSLSWKNAAKYQFPTFNPRFSFFGQNIFRSFTCGSALPHEKRGIKFFLDIADV